ncbi:MAG: helix-turn-helix domain-containing protein [Bacteroidales bacterium]|jgi:excisionase family DNA binding protein|nr:helix-turn-helix domain-containing protein [Bacteroidales bacterium]
MEENRQFGEVLNLRETAEYLRVCEATVYSYAKNGKLPGRKMGNKWRFSKQALDRFLEKKG